MRAVFIALFLRSFDIGEDKGVIGALTEELQAVSDLTGGYANLRTTIQGLIADYEELLESVVNA